MFTVNHFIFAIQREYDICKILPKKKKIYIGIIRRIMNLNIVKT